MPPRGQIDDDDDAIWVPVTLHLPLGLTKSFNPDNCAPVALICGPFSIILLAQTANTILVPVLPFLVTDVGASVVSYGLLQSTLWTSQTVLAPIQGWMSDRLGRRPVIIISLLFSAAGNALLAMSTTVATMMVARTISGLGFQIALFRAYFADTAEKKERTGRFGLIGVITNFALFAGPFLGGLVSRVFSRRAAAWLSAALCCLAALIAICWQPDEKRVEEATMQRSDSFQLKGEELAAYKSTHKTVDGVKLIKIDLNAGPPKPDQESGRRREDRASAERFHDGCMAWGPCRYFRKTWKFARWLAQYDLYPLLSLNFFFRFAFAAYKSVFAFFCMGVMNYGSDRVGYLLSAMGIAGIFVQGALVRVVVSRLGEEKTLFAAMAATAGGFILLSLARSLTLLVPALTFIAIGYGLCVPCITTLFSHVPVEQGLMQGIAGAIDRFGQAFGPVVGGSLLHLLGEASLMRWTGVALAAISLVCLAFIGDGWMSWLLASCTPNAGYQQVSALEAIDEEDEEDVLTSGEPSPQVVATKGEADPFADLPSANLANGVAAALANGNGNGNGKGGEQQQQQQQQQNGKPMHSPVSAQPAV